MKLRIQDNSIRFRMTLKELDALGTTGRLERICRLPDGGAWHYAVVVDRALEASRVAFGAGRIELTLSAADHATLADPSQEGVYIRREWTDAAGASQRFMVFVEKDRPGSTCTKPEAWIYDGHHGGDNVVVPIPPQA
ncbi:MAG: hypothetical protein KF858_08105 [Candidatus Sumerlaeia bacterium]|nr:hypothetical protein [Candidatus Sumerlaeia bacterium]